MLALCALTPYAALVLSRPRCDLTVHRYMLSSKHHAKVLWSVVKRVFVDMMNNFSREELPAKYLLGNDPMLVLPSLTDASLNNAVRCVPNSVKTGRPNWMSLSYLSNDTAFRFKDFRGRWRVLTTAASLGVVKGISIFPAPRFNRLPACTAQLVEKFFRHMTMYANFHWSARCLSRVVVSSV
jgi:hypothetical protein